MSSFPAHVYLIHLDSPIHHAKHYLGYTALESVDQRLQRHQRGHGAKLLARANVLGIHYQIVKVWACTTIQEAKQLERRLKRRHDSPALCPVCQGQPSQVGSVIFPLTQNPPEGGISPDCNLPF